MKKINALEMLLLVLMTLSISLSICGNNVELTAIHFAVDMNEELANVEDLSTIGIRGNMAPLDWETTYFLTDENKDGIYEGTLNFEKTENLLEFKFVHDNVVWELATEQNRVLDFSKPNPTYVWNENPPLTAEEIKALTIPKAKLLEDFELVKTAYTTIHPGLYRYNTPEQITEHLAVLKQDLSKDLTIPEAYLAFSKFVAKIKCGHTYANFWNQPMIVKRAITYQKDKVPFHFRLIDHRMILTESAVDQPALKKGVEVLSINGHSLTSILAELMPIVKSDGANDGQRLIDLQLFGADKFESFDMYFPLVFPPNNGNYTLEIKDLLNGTTSTVVVPAMSRKERIQLINKRFPKAIPSEADFWQFEILNEETALLTLHTFSIWGWDMDWKGFIKNAFDTAKEENIQNVIIDIRRNGGGADMVYLEVFKHIAQKPFGNPARKELYRFREFPASVKPYLNTWDDWFENGGIQKLKPIEPGYFSMGGKISKATTYKPYKNPFKGEVYLMVSPANSSATYYMAGAAKRNGLATLVGQETGGNQRGINGGQIYFMILPNSKIEVDLPIGGDFQIGDLPNKGYDPDIFVKPNPLDIAKGIDTELAATLALIAKKKE